MKKLLICFSLAILASCQPKASKGAFGEKFENTGAIDFKAAIAQYNSGKDSTYIISGKIENVCQGEGCWISFKNDSTQFLVNTHETFTMPKDSKGKMAIAKGKFVKNEEGELEFQPSGVIIE